MKRFSHLIIILITFFCYNPYIHGSNNNCLSPASLFSTASSSFNFDDFKSSINDKDSRVDFSKKFLKQEEFFIKNFRQVPVEYELHKYRDYLHYDINQLYSIIAGLGDKIELTEEDRSVLYKQYDSDISDKSPPSEDIKKEAEEEGESISDEAKTVVDEFLEQYDFNYFANSFIDLFAFLNDNIGNEALKRLLNQRDGEVYRLIKSSNQYIEWTPQFFSFRQFFLNSLYLYESGDLKSLRCLIQTLDDLNNELGKYFQEKKSPDQKKINNIINTTIKKLLETSGSVSRLYTTTFNKSEFETERSIRTSNFMNVFMDIEKNFRGEDEKESAYEEFDGISSNTANEDKFTIHLGSMASQILGFMKNSFYLNSILNSKLSRSSKNPKSKENNEIYEKLTSNEKMRWDNIENETNKKSNEKPINNLVYWGEHASLEFTLALYEFFQNDGTNERLIDSEGKLVFFTDINRFKDFFTDKTTIRLILSENNSNITKFKSSFLKSFWKTIEAFSQEADIDKEEFREYFQNFITSAGIANSEDAATKIIEQSKKDARKDLNKIVESNNKLKKLKRTLEDNENELKRLEEIENKDEELLNNIHNLKSKNPNLLKQINEIEKSLAELQETPTWVDKIIFEVINSFKKGENPDSDFKTVFEGQLINAFISHLKGINPLLQTLDEKAKKQENQPFRNKEKSGFGVIIGLNNPALTYDSYLKNKTFFNDFSTPFNHPNDIVNGSA